MIEVVPRWRTRVDIKCKNTAKTIFRIPSSCASAVSAPRMMISCGNTKTFPPFILCYPFAVPRIYSSTFGKSCAPLHAKKRSWIVYLNFATKRFLWSGQTTPWVCALSTFCILTRDPATAAIFPAPLVIAHRRDLSLRDIQVHTPLTGPRQRYQEVQPLTLLYNILEEKVPLLYTFIEKRYPFHIPTLEHCTPFSKPL